jgi:hypothetical protein
MADYSFVKGPNEAIRGLWLRDSEKVEDNKFLAKILIKHGYQGLKSEFVQNEDNEPVSLGELVLLDEHRVVPNSFDDSGGCFVMFGPILAPVEEDVNERIT